MFPRSLCALVLAAAPFAPAALAQDQAALPKGETVLEQYVEATGGRAAYEKVKNRVSTGTLEVAGAGIKGSITLTQAEPDKQVSTIDLGALGKSSQGSDGKVAWEVSALMGERVLEGDELDDTLLRALFNPEIRWKDRVAKVECTGVEDIDGKPAYKLVLTPKKGKPMTEWYDKVSHLQVKNQTTTKGPMGELTVDNYPSDYKKVDGILIPFVSKQKVFTQEIIFKLDEVKQNVDLPEDTFKLPEPIQAILKKKEK